MRMISQATAGIVGGFPLALAALWVATGIGSWEARVTTALLLSLPLWWVVMLLAYRLPAGWRAWAGMLLANAVAFALLRLAHGLGAMGAPA